MLRIAMGALALLTSCVTTPQVRALDFLAAVVSKWAGTRAHLAQSRPRFLETMRRVESHEWVAPVFRAHWEA